MRVEISGCLAGPSVAMHSVLAKLRRVQRARNLEVFFGSLLRSCSVVGCGLLVVCFWRYLFQRPILTPADAFVSGLIILAWISIAFFRFRWPMPVTAAWLDRWASTRSRFLTVVAFDNGSPGSAWRIAALRECGQFVESFDESQWTRPRIPKRWWIGFAPWIAMTLLVAEDGLRQSPLPVESGGFPKEAAETLKQFATQLNSLPLATEPEIRKLIDELNKSVARLQRSPFPRAEGEKRTFEELARIEQMLHQVRDSQLTAAELQALLNALSENESTRSIAQLLRDNKNKEAADELEKLAERVRNHAEKTLRELAESLQESLGRPTEAERSEAMRQLQQELTDASSANSSEMQKFLKELAQMAREGKLKRADSAAPVSEALVRSIEDLKNALRNGSLRISPREEPNSPTQLSNFGRDLDQRSGATGKPGDDKVTAELRNRPPTDPLENSGQAKKLPGMPGPGELSLDIVSSMVATGKATREYKQLFEAVMPRNEEAIQQEDIPLESRDYIKRYFERIRPRE